MISHEEFIKLTGVSDEEAYREWLALEPDAQKDVLEIMSDPDELQMILLACKTKQLPTDQN